MDDYQLNFGDCAPLLHRNGYAPVPLEAGRPIGPFARFQIPRHESDNALPAGVLTAVPPALSLEAPILNWRDTWLATIAARVRADLTDEVDALLARHIGDGKRVHRVEDDGSLRIVLRLTDERLFTHSTGTHDDDQYVRVSAGHTWLPLTGEWSVPGGLLVVTRSELPAIDTERAAALVESVDELLYERDAPLPLYTPKAIVPLPDLAKGERLQFGNKRARQLLKGNGWGACPVPFGESRPSDKWTVSASLGVLWQSSCDEMGVGIGLSVGAHHDTAAVEVTGADPEQVARADAVIVAKLGAGLLRVAADGSRVRLYDLHRYGRPKEAQWLISADTGTYDAARNVRVTIRTSGVVVASGLDAAGNPYLWPSGSPLDTLRDRLPVLGADVTNQHGHPQDHVREALRTAISAPDGAAPNTTRRRAARA